MSRRLIETALLAVILTASAAPALDSGAARCRNLIAVKAQKLVVKTVQEEAGCHKERMLGLLTPTVDCSDPDKAGFPASAAAKVAQAANALLAGIGTACSGQTPAGLGYSTCPTPCGAEVPTLTGLSDVARCVVCAARHAASDAVATTYGAAPPVFGQQTDALTCQDRYVGNGLRTYGKQRMAKQRACQHKEDRDRIGATDCKAADLTGAIAAARSRLYENVGRCNAADFATLSSCAAATAAEQLCVQSAADTMADALFDVVYPSVPATPTPTAVPPTSTRTPTLTRTPTATADSSCAAASFLDLSDAPGAGAGYAAPSLSVTCSGATVSVQSNGIPPYSFVQTTPNALQAVNNVFTFPRSPAVAAATTILPLLGTVGVAVNGLPVFGPNEAAQPDAYGDPVAAAILDECMGHTAQRGDYHYHALLVKCLTQSALVAEPWSLDDPPTDQPSPIIAYAFDGFPIYGPYECTDAACTAVQEMRSGFDNTGYTAGTQGCTSSSACGSSGYCVAVLINGQPQAACVPRTCTWSNNHYVAKAGAQYLDQCNGHVGPNGDYHYHATATFPYILGCYRGTPTNNGGNGTPPGGSCS